MSDRGTIEDGINTEYKLRQRIMKDLKKMRRPKVLMYSSTGVLLTRFIDKANGILAIAKAEDRTRDADERAELRLKIPVWIKQGSKFYVKNHHRKLSLQAKLAFKELGYKVTKTGLLIPPDIVV